MAISPLAINLAKAAIIYDTKNAREKLESLGIKYLTWTPFESGTDFFVVAGLRDCVEVLFRGTHGLQAWTSNLNETLDPSKCYHRDFHDSALTAIAKMEEAGICPDVFRRSRFFGHSRATGIIPHLAIRLCEKMERPPEMVEIYNYAIAPTFTNSGISQIWNPAHEKYGIVGYNVVNPRDALTGYRYGPLKLRGCMPSDGADTTLSRITLPPDSAFQRIMKKVFPNVDSLAEHSPREYADGMMIMCKSSPETVAFLKDARKLFVN